VFQIRPTKEITGQIKGNDVADTVFENFATADDPTDHKEDVFGVVSLTGDKVFAVCRLLAGTLYLLPLQFQDIGEPLGECFTSNSENAC
jgi:hypothetical protein